MTIERYWAIIWIVVGRRFNYLLDGSYVKKRKKAMHFIVSWDINAEGEKWDALNAQLKECIEAYSWARPLSTFYVVRVSAPQEWQEIKKNLIEVAEGSPIRVHLVIGPLMSGGQYDGYLPKDFWPELEKRIA